MRVHGQGQDKYDNVRIGLTARLDTIQAAVLIEKLKIFADEIDARNRGYSPYSTETWRAWEYWANKAGCGHMLTRPDD